MAKGRFGNALVPVAAEGDASDADADAIAFTSRGGGWFDRILTGDPTRDMLDETERPVVVPAVNP
jgi:nucleotide-binding universal stress UspA family protein